MSTPVGNISTITLPNGDTYNIKDAVARQGGVTYTLSISNNVITLVGSNSTASTVALPGYNGGVS